MLELQTAWGWLIALYLFLAGVSAGAYLSAFFAWYKRGDDNLTTRTGILITLPCLILSIIFLFLDLGRPMNFVYAFLRPYSSVIAAGTWILTLFFFICGIQWLGYIRNKKLSSGSLLWGTGFVLAILTAFYTGVLLWDVRGVPFWNSFLVPLLFLASAISTGISAVLIGVFGFVSKKHDINQEAENLKFLCHADMWGIGIETCILIIYLVSMGWSSNAAAIASVNRLLTGALSLSFWFLVIVVGLVTPFYLEWKLKKIEELSPKFISKGILAGLCVFIGGFTLRYLILAAGILGTSRNLL
ncbi:NrfD/PsrC family molybdoenzyme membrane anchor subunit [Thermodesulfovibrio thiophilus]|uniref:NrfD/PsrC family molybdoenzyme membrane anchor subunit n=1 Tax=Thermodesulfovibrio thiophilus TaxID=340095 RepID=UPI000401422D|nr:NrfD/PsrC family molybdoenzyme membrane anchor subunit [Thermodesulfovibrio thiophilus]